jgi:hypothetical protein
MEQEQLDLRETLVDQLEWRESRAQLDFQIKSLNSFCSVLRQEELVLDMTKYLK